MPPRADILLERFVYPGRLPPDLSPAQLPSRTRSFHRLLLTAERISCAHRIPITPCSFYLHCLRALQRLVGQRFHSALASRSGNHASRRRDGTTSVRDAAARAITLTAPFTTTARPPSPFPSVKTLSNPVRTSQLNSIHKLASGFNLLLFRYQEIRPRRLPNFHYPPKNSQYPNDNRTPWRPGSIGGCM